MGYAIVSLLSFIAGFIVCWVYRSRVVSVITKERDALKSSAGKFVSKI